MNKEKNLLLNDLFGKDVFAAIRDEVTYELSDLPHHLFGDYKKVSEWHDKDGKQQSGYIQDLGIIEESCDKGCFFVKRA